MSIPAMSFYICSILKHHCAWDWRRWVGVVEGRQTLYVACGGCYHWCTLYKKRNNKKGLFIYIVTKSCFVDNKIIMNLILFLVSFISCIEAFYNRKRNLRTSVSSELLRWPRLRETETSLLLWRRMTRDEKSWLMNGIEQKWRHDCTAASHVSRPGAVLDPGKSIWPKKASGRLPFFFFYSRGTLLRITSSQKMRGKLYYALS